MLTINQQYLQKQNCYRIRSIYLEDYFKILKLNNTLKNKILLFYYNSFLFKYRKQQIFIILFFVFLRKRQIKIPLQKSNLELITQNGRQYFSNKLKRKLQKYQNPFIQQMIEDDTNNEEDKNNCFPTLMDAFNQQTAIDSQVKNQDNNNLLSNNILQRNDRTQVQQFQDKKPYSQPNPKLEKFSFLFGEYEKSIKKTNNTIN
ncbi:hypothetical protein TTHERM_000006469 (macronuclear) [Tetrahymena thermophila SB210]|uniref:Uncharacterized protein n=1 Tax=Tetrahymena thermophila (strain SB210) TaxID=312017 RepID=W7XLH7_TETTS|nr:hypothetical protein TTHERM_000006469 [Tetrahymena thermophila SB210]EWS76309.1 hypothetical protein TTHERM_000006469 [Tetrahymena thermophila SB210]|eukprot:XP_012651093.1 hypothetical protein TTHERM_000006469 [Tetrahymena thermophila SB210]